MTGGRIHFTFHFHDWRSYSLSFSLSWLEVTILLIFWLLSWLEAKYTLLTVMTGGCIHFTLDCHDWRSFSLYPYSSISSGSGQGDPLFSILFLIGSEPLNRLIVAKFAEIMYTTMEKNKSRVYPLCRWQLVANKNRENRTTWSFTGDLWQIHWSEWAQHQPQEVLSTVHQHTGRPGTRLSTQGVYYAGQNEALGDRTGQDHCGHYERNPPKDRHKSSQTKNSGHLSAYWHST